MASERTMVSMPMWAVILGVVAAMPTMVCAAAGDTSRWLTIDIRSACNMGFEDSVADDQKGGWTDQGANDLRELPVGRQEFRGVPFDIIDPATNDGRACIMLKGKERPYFLSEVTGIAVNHTLRRHVLHSGAWGGGDATYSLEYADGTTASKKIECGRNIGDWANPVELPEAKLAWTGRSLSGAAALWVMSWDNPHPDKQVVSIRLQSLGTGAITGVVAITAECGEVSVDGGSSQASGRLEGLMSLTQYGFYRGQAITGTLRLKNKTTEPIRGHVVAQITLGDVVKSQATFKLFRDCAYVNEVWNIDITLPNDLVEGIYRCEVFFEATIGGGQTQRIALDVCEVASMGAPPAEPLTAENFRTYSEPLHLMIGYVHDDAQLRRDFAEMKAKGFDLACLEWFWRMVDRGEGQPNDFGQVDRVIAMAESAGLKYWMYYGLWDHAPDRMAGVVDENGSVGKHLDVHDAKTRAGLVRLYEETAAHLKNNPTVIGYTIRLHPSAYADHSPAARAAWANYLAAKGFDTREKVLALYAGANASDVYDEAGLIRVPKKDVQKNPRQMALWHTYIVFIEDSLISMMEQLCQAIRRHDTVKPIRLNLAQSYEGENNECVGFSQIGMYRLAEKYGGVVNQECFEYPIHSSKEPPLAEKYGVVKTTEGGGVPMYRPGIAALMSHAIEMNVAYVAYCHWLVRNDLFEWYRYKPFFKLRKSYKQVYDNLTVTSFWKDAWVGDDLRGTYFQYHFNVNLGLVASHYAFEMVNEDLLKRGRVTPGSVVVDTNSFYIGDATCQDIRAFIDAGGTFVANHLTSVNTFDGGEEYALQRKHLGVEVQSGKVGLVRCRGKVLGARKGFSMKATKADRVLATWQDGAPAAMIRTIGKGKAMIVGFSLESDDFHATKGVAHELLKMAGVRRHLSATCSEAGLAADASGGRFVTLLNSRSEPVTATVTVRDLSANAAYTVMDRTTQQTQTVTASSTGEVTFHIPIAGTAVGFAEIKPVVAATEKK